MNGIFKTSKLVKAVLTDIPATRNSDSYLYLKVLERVAGTTEIDLKGMTVPYFLCNIKKLNFPYFETVRRARQKMQRRYPELKAVDEIEAARAENETEYRAFALSKELFWDMRICKLPLSYKQLRTTNRH